MSEVCVFSFQFRIICQVYEYIINSALLTISICRILKDKEELKVKLALCLKLTLMGGWKYSFTTLDLCARWRWVVGFRSWTLYLRGKNPRYPLLRRLGEPQNYRKISCPCWDSNSGRPVHIPSLYSLSYLLSGSWMINIINDFRGDTDILLGEEVYRSGKIRHV
jgi:hypothetical protein